MHWERHSSLEGIIEVTNTDERKSDLVERIQIILNRGTITGKEATSLRSRLNFAADLRQNIRHDVETSFSL